MIHSCLFRKPDDSNQADEKDTSLPVEEKVQSQTEKTLSRSCDEDDNKRYFLFWLSMLISHKCLPTYMKILIKNLIFLQANY